MQQQGHATFNYCCTGRHGAIKLSLRAVKLTTPYKENVRKKRTYWFPRSHMPSWTRDIHVTCLGDRWLRTQDICTLNLIHHRWQPTTQNLFTVHLPNLVAPLPTCLTTWPPFTKEPVWWTWVCPT